jgi:regulatory protein spx
MKEAKRQRKEWNKELFEISEVLKEELKSNIRALETYKIIEEIYSIQSFPQSNIAYQHQKLRLVAYNRKYNKKIISKKEKGKMLKIFVKSSCSSSRMVKKWLKQFHIDYKEQNIQRITREDLIHIVSLSEFGFEELIVEKTARATNARAFIMKLSFVEAIDFLLENPTLLRVPLIVGENKLQIGYNDQEIRQFISREKRKLKRGDY